MDLARVSSGGCRPEEDAATAHTTAFFLSREVRRELAGDRGGTCRERGARLERGAVGRGACREIGLDLASAPNRERGHREREPPEGRVWSAGHPRSPRTASGEVEQGWCRLEERRMSAEEHRRRWAGRTAGGQATAAERKGRISIRGGLESIWRGDGRKKLVMRYEHKRWHCG